jgi:hypothetical protein
MAPAKTPNTDDVTVDNQVENLETVASHVDEKDHTDYGRVDKELAKYISDARIEISPEKNDELRRKIDKRILLVMILTYFLQAIDKGTMSFASIMGIRDDTNLSKQDVSHDATPCKPCNVRPNANRFIPMQYNWLTTCIYITILVVEYPQNYIIARVPIAKYLGVNIMAWGAVLASTAACTNLAGLVTVRTLLGLFESVCQPSFVVLSAMWYKREEQASRVTYW